MTENPPPGMPPRDEPDTTPDAPAWEEPAAGAQDDYQYDAWLAAEDELHADAPEPATEDDAPEPATEDDAPEHATEDDAPEQADEAVEAPIGTVAHEPLWTDDPGPTPEEPTAEEPAAAEAVSEEAESAPTPDEPGGEHPADPEPVADEVVAAPEAGEPAVPDEAEPLAPQPAEPGTADPSVAVAAAPLVDPVVPDTVEDVPVEQQPAAASVPAGAEAAEDGAVPTTRPAQALLAALVAAVVLLAALTGFLAWLSHDTAGGGEVAKARVAALTASRNAARVVFSYDYRHLQKDFAAGKTLITGQFAQEYARTTGKIVDDVAGRYKAVVAADVTDAAVVRASSDQVVTLLFLTQQSTSTLSASTKITQSRLEMTMVHRHGRWLVSNIRAF